VTWRIRLGAPVPSGCIGSGRDGGFAAGALLAGLVAVACGIVSAVWVVAAITAASGVVVLGADVRDAAVRAGEVTWLRELYRKGQRSRGSGLR
jgi:hypothetical protein